MVTPDAAAVARWMLGELETQGGLLYQETVVYDIASEFGDDFVYENENGNLAISQAVLREFRRLTEKTVVWERGTRFWRWREDYDASGKRQAE